MSDKYSWLEDLKRQNPAPAQRPTTSGSASGLASTASDLVGGIFRAVSMDHDQRPGIVAVVDADEASRSATVVLLTAEVEMGGDRDLLLTPAETGLGYEVIAQAEIAGYVWLVQLERKLGALDSALVQQLLELQNAEPDALEPDLRAGPPIVSRRDVRWSFKSAELARLQDLTGPCTSQLIDGEPRASIDPFAFPSPAEGIDKLELLEHLLNITELVRRGDADLPAWLLDALLDDELVQEWREHGLFDAYAGLLSLITQALPGIREVPIPVENASSLRGDRGALRIQVLAERRRSGVSSVPMYSRRPTAAAATMFVEKVTLPGGSLVQCVAVSTADLELESVA